MTSVSLHRALPHEVFQTYGRAIADSLAMQLDPRELRSFSAALHSVAHCTDAVFTSRSATAGTEWALGGTIADHVVAGEMLIVFSDARPKRGYTGAHVSIEAIAEYKKASPGRRQQAEINAVARRISARIGRKETGVERAELQHAGLIALAGCILTEPDVQRLAAMRDRVSVLAVIGDTRSVGITSGRFFSAIRRLPGDWFGTSEIFAAAGRC